MEISPCGFESHQPDTDCKECSYFEGLAQLVNERLRKAQEVAGSSPASFAAIHSAIFHLPQWPSGRRRRSCKPDSQEHRRFESCLGLHKRFVLKVVEVQA